MIDYLLEQELTNLLPTGRTVATLLSRVEVDFHDPAFEHITKPIDPYKHGRSQRPYILILHAISEGDFSVERGFVF